MDVILDTNIYTALLLSQGRKIFSSNAFIELFTYLRRTRSNLIFPGPVFDEIIKEYSDLISGSVKEAQDRWTTLQRNTMTQLMDCFPPNPDAEVKTFQEELSHPAMGFEVVILKDYKDIPLGEVVRRGVHRIRPANDNGEELRDVVIWLIALEHAKAKNSKIAFISNDAHFKGPDGSSFHPDLLRDLATHKVEVLYYDSIPKFVRDNSLEASVIKADEIASMVKDGAIADLVTDRFMRSKFEDVMVSDIQFQGAQKYKVADDSFYVEAKYTSRVRYSETVHTPSWLLGSHFAPSGSTLLPPAAQFNLGYFAPELRPFAIKKILGAVANIAVSFRIVSGTSQSVEILDLEKYSESTITEFPVMPPEGSFFS